jgi:hypothetical protein
VKNKAKFDIYKVKPIDHVASMTVPTVFVIGQQDDVVKTPEFFALHAKCGSQYKKLFVALGDHTANRLDDDDFRQEMVTFVGYFFPMRKKVEEIIGVLKNKSMANFIRSRMSQGPNTVTFDFNKLKNSVMMERNNGLRKYTVDQYQLEPHLSALNHVLTSQAGDIAYGPTLIPAKQAQSPALKTAPQGSPLFFAYGNGFTNNGQHQAVSNSSQSSGNIVVT